MTATLKPSEENVVLDKFGMKSRPHVIIKSTPIVTSSFYQLILRPSNQTDYYADKGLRSILYDLFLRQYVSDPLESKVAIFLFRQEDCLSDVYLDLENELGERFPVNSKRPFVMYHGASGAKTIQNVHDRIKSEDNKITLYLATEKLLQG